MKLGEEARKRERDLLFTSTRAFFCIDASAYLILDIALLTVLPDRAGRNAVNGRAWRKYRALERKEAAENLKTSRALVDYHDLKCSGF